MVWQIDYYNSKVEAEILSLQEGLSAQYFWFSDFMIKFAENWLSLN